MLLPLISAPLRVVFRGPDAREAEVRCEHHVSALDPNIRVACRGWIVLLKAVTSKEMRLIGEEPF